MNTKRALDILADEGEPQVSGENRVYGFWAVVVAPLFLLGWLIALFWLGALAVEGYWGLVRVAVGG